MHYIDFVFKVLYNISMNYIDEIKLRYEMLSPFLNESNRRLLAGVESSIIGHGGIVAVNKATGLARNTIRRGKKDLENLENMGLNSIRKAGGGRKKKQIKTPNSKVCSKI